MSDQRPASRLSNDGNTDRALCALSDYMTKMIPLTRGYEAIVDDEDYDSLVTYKWYCASYKRGNYAITWADGQHILMHRMITRAPRGLVVDHINSNGLDNRKSNLRICTNAQNIQHSKKQSNNSSGYRGVYWYKKYGKWRARIGVNGKRIGIGYYDNKNEAALAYNEAAKKYHGEFAVTNHVDFVV